MDVTLIGATASLSVYLPKCVFGYQSRTERMSMATAIGLSLGLFSLCLLEALPSSWLILLAPAEAANPNIGPSSSGGFTSGLLTISRAYWLLLWTLSLVILVVFPGLAGVALAETFQDFFLQRRSMKDDDDRKKGFWKKTWRNSPLWIRFLGGLVRIVFKNAWRLCRTIFGSRRSSAPEPALAMSMSEDDLRQIPSGDMELRGLVRGAPNTTTASKPRCWMVLGSIAGVSTVLVVVTSLGPLVVHTRSDKDFLSIIVSWLCAIGLMISSLLNGFGSVSMPYSCLAGLYLKPVRPEIITKLEAELQSVRESTAKKRTTVREITVAVKQGSTRSTTTSSSGLSSFVSSKVRSFAGIGDELENRRQILQTEIDFLESLCQDMKEDIDELRHSRGVAAAARTTMGKVRSYVGLIFSIILLVRLGSAGRTIWKSYTEDTSRHKVANGDIVTTSLLWLTGHDLVSQSDHTMLSQVVSLGLTALLSFSQIRTFLRTVAIVHRRLSRFYEKCHCMKSSPLSSTSNTIMEERSGVGLGLRLGSVTSGVFSQLIAGATGCYFLSCIVLIKMMLPEEFCEGFAIALGGVDVFTIHTYVVNTVFACSAGVSVAIFAMLFGIQRQNNLRHTRTTKLSASALSESGVGVLLGAEAV